MTFTPRRFGILQGALRDTYELVAALPGNEALGALIEDRVGRLNKLVLNGWDDRDQDQLISWPSECAQLGTGPDGKPMGRGGLQMAERTLTGESGSLDASTPDGGDRIDHHRPRARLRPRDLGGASAVGAGQLDHLHADTLDAGAKGAGVSGRRMDDAVAGDGREGGFVHSVVGRERASIF